MEPSAGRVTPAMAMEPSRVAAHSELVDEARAPDWILSHTMWQRRDLARWRGRYHWLYQWNQNRVVSPAEGEQKGSFGESVVFHALDGASRSHMARLLGSEARFEVIIHSPPDDSGGTLDKSDFVVRIATTEYYPSDWQRTVTRDLATELDIAPEQIELTVPPNEPVPEGEWVEGTTLNPIPRLAFRASP